LTNLLEVRDLEARLGKRFKLGPANFAFGRGIVYVEGPNGGGKTTLMRALAGELQPSAGTVQVCGRDVHRSADARRDISFVPATPELPDFLSVAEAYEFTAAIRGMKDWNGREYLEALDLDPTLPLGNASAGQRQKAELVCGLAADPQVLLLDETFTHLDAHGVDVLEHWVAQWRESRLVVVTHHGGPPVPPDFTLHVEEGRVESRPGV
jgi:ABC-2 type transport system ATP-binding protein